MFCIDITVQTAYRVFSGKNKNPRKIVEIIDSYENKHQILTQGKNTQGLSIEPGLGK